MDVFGDLVSTKENRADEEDVLVELGVVLGDILGCKNDMGMSGKITSRFLKFINIYKNQYFMKILWLIKIFVIEKFDFVKHIFDKWENLPNHKHRNK